MKLAFSAVLLGGLLFFVSRDVQAQMYDVYYYWDGAQYQQYSPQPQYEPYYVGNEATYQQTPAQYYDPYYQLHVVHYQLYLPQYQPYYSGVAPVYAAPCCFVGGVVVPARRTRINPRPPGVIGPFPRGIRRR